MHVEYYTPRLLLHFTKWFAAFVVILCGLILLFALVDWLGHAVWGYPWYTAPIVIGITGVGILVYRAADYALRRN
jgi:hypothetical protein